jgi:site-specific DNA recombinase
MKPVTSAGIYARISLDSEGEGKGVKRQIADCQKLATELGWPVVEEYVDNDVSAYSGKARPAYERMLQDIESGAIDAILVYNLDRLTRRPKEFEAFNEIATGAGFANVRFVTGGMDLGTDDGLFIGRIQAAAAAQESATKGRRQRRKNDEKAMAGLPHGGAGRPFAFESDRITHRDDEARSLGRWLIGTLRVKVLHRWSAGSATRTSPPSGAVPGGRTSWLHK